MGKVLAQFRNGFPGAVSRAVDDIVVSLKNGSGGAIAFGAPVFLKSDNTGACVGYSSAITTADRFLGFAVRAADKTPSEYGSSLACYEAGDPVDVLVRGSMVLEMEDVAYPGQPVYIRKADGKLTASAGAADSTILLPNVTVRTVMDGSHHAEAVIRQRNLI